MSMNEGMRRYDRARGRFLIAGTDYAKGTTNIPEAKVGSTRSFVRLWDVDGGQVAPVSPSAGWQRGQIVRGSQYVFVLTAIGPMYDPTNPLQSHYTRPNI